MTSDDYDLLSKMARKDRFLRMAEEARVEVDDVVQDA